MAEKKKKRIKKINQLNLQDCEDILKRIGNQQECLWVQGVVQRMIELQAGKTFAKNKH